MGSCAPSKECGVRPTPIPRARPRHVLSVSQQRKNKGKGPAAGLWSKNLPSTDWHTVIPLQIANSDLIAYTPFGVETNAEPQVPCLAPADTHEGQNDEHAKPVSRCFSRNEFS